MGAEVGGACCCDDPGFEAPHATQLESVFLLSTRQVSHDQPPFAGANCARGWRGEDTFTPALPRATPNGPWVGFSPPVTRLPEAPPPGLAAPQATHLEWFALFCKRQSGHSQLPGTGANWENRFGAGLAGCSVEVGVSEAVREGPVEEGGCDEVTGGEALVEEGGCDEVTGGEALVEEGGCDEVTGGEGPVEEGGCDEVTGGEALVEEGGCDEVTGGEALETEESNF